MTTQTAPAPTALKPCTCSTFSFGSYGEDGSAESFTDYGTDCTQVTKRLFAQGHDAKLVGYLVRAELAGEEIGLVEGGMRVTFEGAVKAASTVSEALGAKAHAQLDAALARTAKKAAREGEKATKQAAKAGQGKSAQPEPATIKAKVGRWTYEGVELNGAFHYSGKVGGSKVAAAGSWSRV